MLQSQYAQTREDLRRTSADQWSIDWNFCKLRMGLLSYKKSVTFWRLSAPSSQEPQQCKHHPTKSR